MACSKVWSVDQFCYTIILLIIAFYVFNAYIYNEKQGNSTPTPTVIKDFEGEADPSRMTLGMKSWQWISVTYSDGTKIIPKQTRAFTLDFNNDGTFSATTDCNRIGGKFEAKNGAIKFGDITTTLMYCEGSQEADFQKVLTRAAGYLFTSKGELVLDIERDSGSAIFR